VHVVSRLPHLDDDRRPLDLLGTCRSDRIEVTRCILDVGAVTAYQPADWQDSIIEIETGAVEIEMHNGTAIELRAGDIFSFTGLPVRALHNRHNIPAVLVTATRRRTPITDSPRAPRRPRTRDLSTSTHPNPKGTHMLTHQHAFSGIAVQDMAAARRFYTNTLGLTTSDEHGLMWLHHPNDHKTLVYEQPGTIPASYTVLNFEVDNIDDTVTALTERGVQFERYAHLDQDDLGVFRGDGPYVAWFKDPSGNVLSVLQERG
jgi:catechol 2,3-dioxygenase-like lactoylglutathione lyase family enzyme